jgi:hypothetical protein
MNREEIIRMAQYCWPSDRRMWSIDADLPRLGRFAELVIEAERKRLATECAMLPFGDTAASFAVWIKNGGKA